VKRSEAARAFPRRAKFTRGAYNALMSLGPDDTVCYCFHVSLRKIETFCRVEKPRHPSEISLHLSAGSGCGWCVPMLEQIHQRICGCAKPEWKQTPDAAPPPADENRANESLDAAAYQEGRKHYIQEGKGKPPAEAEQ
jgi:bacterioferritin-associated ferredoxin